MNKTYNNTGSIIYCDRVKHFVSETVDEIEAALRYPENGYSVESLGEVVWRMTDGPPGFIKVTPLDSAGYCLSLSIDKISSYEVHWTT